jgi:hypothetical protein
MKTKFFLFLLLLVGLAPLARAQYPVTVVADPIAIQNEVAQIAKWTESIATLNQQLVEDLSQQLRFICYFILTAAIVVRTGRGSTSIGQLVRPIVTNIPGGTMAIAEAHTVEGNNSSTSLKHPPSDFFGSLGITYVPSNQASPSA